MRNYFSVNEVHVVLHPLNTIFLWSLHGNPLSIHNCTREESVLKETCPESFVLGFLQNPLCINPSTSKAAFTRHLRHAWEKPHRACLSISAALQQQTPHREALLAFPHSASALPGTYPKCSCRCDAKQPFCSRVSSHWHSVKGKIVMTVRKCSVQSHHSGPSQTSVGPLL